MGCEGCGCYVHCPHRGCGSCLPLDYQWYAIDYGGELPEGAFASVLPAAVRHVDWLCGDAGRWFGTREYKRAVCAVVDVFAEWGEADAGGFTLGEFKVAFRSDGHGSGSGTSGEELATKAALKELFHTGAAFSGVS